MIKLDYTLIAKQEETGLSLESSYLGKMTLPEAEKKASEVGRQWIDAYHPTTILITLVQGNGGLGIIDSWEEDYDPHEDTP